MKEVAMEERPLIEVGLDALKQIFATFSPGRTRPESYAAIAKLVARLENDLPNSEVRICLTGFSEHVDSTQFAIQIEKVGPGRCWKVVDTSSKVFHMDERWAVRLWFEVRIEGHDNLQYCTDRKQRSPWRKADEAGVDALLAEVKELWKELASPEGDDKRWQSDLIEVSLG
ncbi:MAG: hypothetical protein WCT54_01015 [Patescibacteria group bacterium]|jgi:hypothetical protein